LTCNEGRCETDSTICGGYGECAETVGRVLPRDVRLVDTLPATQMEAFGLLARTLAGEITVSPRVHERMAVLLGWGPV